MLERALGRILITVTVPAWACGVHRRHRRLTDFGAAAFLDRGRPCVVNLLQIADLLLVRLFTIFRTNRHFPAYLLLNI